MKKGRIIVEAGKPLQFQDAVESDSPPSAEQSRSLLIADVFKAYSAAARDLLKGKYACYSEFAPQHLRNPSNITVLECIDGMFVRYDAAPQGNGRVRVGPIAMGLAQVTTQFSDHLIHFGGDPDHPDLDEHAPRITMELKDPSGATKESYTLHLGIFMTGKLPDGFQMPKPPARPIGLLSILNELTLQLGGVVAPADIPLRTDGPDVQQFVAHTRIQLPVGWQAIEIYPFLGDEYWKPEFAATWAESDILAFALQRNLQEAQLNALDPRAETRKQYATLLDEFEHLLQGPEEPVHQFLRQHPELICPTSDRHWSKLAFGTKECDFVFREPHNDYLLVEIEKPDQQLFRKDGQQHENLTHAVNQIADWVRYIEDNKKTVEGELSLSGISTSPRRLVVIGRSKSLTDDNRRKLTTLQNDQPKLRIVTYDDLLSSARTNLERILGPFSLKGENVKLYFFK